MMINRILKLKNSDSGDILDKGNEFGAGFS